MIDEFIPTTDQVPMAKEDCVEEMHQDKQSISQNEPIKDDVSETNIESSQEEDDPEDEEQTGPKMDADREEDSDLKDYNAKT